MRVVKIDAFSRRYAIWIGQNVLQEIGRLLADLRLSSPALIVTDENVAALYLQIVAEALNRAGFRSHAAIIPPGEESKNLATVAYLYKQAVAAGLDRRSPVIALGGGVIGDLAGFAAATYLRGVPLVQVPTTLLAQVDSSVGGKTGVNLPAGKNLVGAFHQPHLVLADIATLKTLPPREFAAGLAEVIKYAVGFDPGLLPLLEKAAGKEAGPEIVEIVARSCAIKGEIVGKDEREETDRRILLNFGHTIGHALEGASGYALLHGEAVGIGLKGAAFIAREMGICGIEVLETVEAALRRFSLPLLHHFSAETVLSFLVRDKKVRNGVIRWVLPVGLGQLSVREDVPMDLVRRAIDYCRAG